MFFSANDFSDDPTFAGRENKFFDDVSVNGESDQFIFWIAGEDVCCLFEDGAVCVDGPFEVDVC